MKIYKELRGNAAEVALDSHVDALVAALRETMSVIEGVEQRCMAADGPVTMTSREITEDELRRIYFAACKALEGIEVPR